MDEGKFIADVNTALGSPEQGLPDEIFDFVASVVPMTNVDLLIENDKHQILLAWRDDGKNLGWHIPGGMLRFKETLHERIQKTALNELGCRVEADDEPLKISEIIMPYQRRGHSISLLYRCRLPKEYRIDNGFKDEHTEGYLRWHDAVPKLVEGQSCYQAFLEELSNS